MKGACLVFMYLMSVSAESPRGRFSRFRSAQQQDGGQNSYGPPGDGDSYGPPAEETESPSGPYPPSGWKPNGELLLVPGETHSSQHQDGSDYGPPPPPSGQYGPVNKPTTTTTTERITTTTKRATTTTEETQEPQEPDGGYPGGENGQYYVLLPDGKLQKVRYSGKKKGRNQYEAQVEYELVDPVRSPVYAYQNLPLNFSQRRAPNIFK